jgi:hypothetical protein
VRLGREGPVFEVPEVGALTADKDEGGTRVGCQEEWRVGVDEGGGGGIGCWIGM